MDGGQGSEDFASVVIKAACVVGSLLVLIGAALFIATRNGDAEPDAVAVSPAGSGPGATANAPGDAFADETAAGGDTPDAASKVGAAPTAPEAESAAELEPSPEPEPAPDPLAGLGADPAGPSSPFGAKPTLVARVRRGQSVELLDAPGGELVAEQGDETQFGSPSVFWVRRRTPGWLGVSAPQMPNGELAWVRADGRRLIDGLIGHSMVVDLSDRTAGLFWEGQEIRSWPVTVGAPGTATPIGRFAVTDTFAGDLDPAYGCCALALSATQPDLPSGWLGGDRIAMHGTAGALGVAASSGCIRSADRDLRALLPVVPLGTPVAIRQ